MTYRIKAQKARFFSVISILFGLFVTCNVASAALVTYRFSGVMTDANNDPLGTFENGARVNGVFTMNSDVQGVSLTLPWADGSVTETRFNNSVTSIAVDVDGGLAPAGANLNISSQLELFDDQITTFADSSQNYYFDRYILTLFGIPGFGLYDPLYFIQLDIRILSHQDATDMFISDGVGSIYPDLNTIKYEPTGESYAGGRFAISSDNRNIGFRIDTLNIINISQLDDSHVDEPSSIWLLFLGFFAIYLVHKFRETQNNFLLTDV